jgi:hypothetical protein
MHYDLLMKYLLSLCYFILPWETDQVGTDTETGT